MKEAIIMSASTVVGTILGTILGWILGKINFGILHISLSNYKEEYLYTDPYAISIPGKKDHELYSARFHFKIRLYNSSSISKAIRDCTLEFYDSNHNLIFERVVEDEDSKTQRSHRVEYNSVEIINVPANVSHDVKAFVRINSIDQMYQVRSIRFKYSDAKFKKHYLKYKAIDFQQVPRFNLKGNNGGSHDG